jgi:hypothetical protein
VVGTGLDGEVSEVSGALPGTKADAAGRKGAGVDGIEGGLAVDGDGDSGAVEADPGTDGDATGCGGERVPVLLVTADEEGLVAGVECHLIAVESVGACGFAVDAKDEGGVAVGVGVESDLDTGEAIGEGECVVDEAGAVGAGLGGEGAVGEERPLAAVGGEAGEWGGAWGLLEALAVEHLGVEAAVNLVVDVLEADAEHLEAERLAGASGIDAEGSGRGLLCEGELGKEEEEEEEEGERGAGRIHDREPRSAVKGRSP